MRDLQRRLALAGFVAAENEPGVYCTATSEAVAQFQSSRGLHVNGTCDDLTWRALVEAGWSLGDRLLVLAAPHQRGDDVVELQNRLNRLGFDCGRPDGILGAATTRAVEEFQRQVGLNPDGVCGPQTVHTLEVVGRQSGTGPGVALVREAESMRDHRSLHALRIVVGQFGGLSAITRALARQLREHGATVISTDEYEATAHAAAANRFGASVYLGFAPRADTRSDISYFAVPTFESVGGRALATQLVAHMGPAMGRTMALRGMRLPVLRETRMPAVFCELGPVRDVVDSTERIVGACFRAIDRWSRAPNQPVELPLSTG